MTDETKSDEPNTPTATDETPTQADSNTQAQPAVSPDSPLTGEAVNEALEAATGAVVAGAAAATAAAVAAAKAETPTASAADTPKPAPSSSDRPVIWSDAGDAPFADDDDKGPVYARKEGAKRERKVREKGGGSEFFEILRTVFFALLIALILRIFLFQPFTIPSASMEPNLYEGDYIIVTKWNYGYSRHAIPMSPRIFEGRIMARSPQRGDIAVFKLPADNKTDYIKRVIGLPGDRVQMINNHLYLNGVQVRDTPLSRAEVSDMFGSRSATRLRETLPNNGASFVIQDLGPNEPLDNTQVFEVPAGYYFMMGDNRDNSVDSRVQDGTGVGFVPAENLIGKAEVILFSWSPGASLFNPVSWFSKLRPSRFFTVLD